ncbi:hypothetical protein [Halorubellus sp. PRR65]|uniref:hypothetical protein n=1 Tax=Halorubellus sp. PRR65 TaxID=3098148 RepID=UPI002B25830A|nr:hypothetical protein [Halorubellus sp. PRR65]
MPADRDDDADAGDGLDAAWGGSGDGDGGPPPRADEAAAQARANAPDGDEEPALVDRITAVLVEHKRVFTAAVLLYGFLVMPWLYDNGYEGFGLAGGVAMLGGVILVTVANAQAARENVQNDERRGF